jgi:hypothetical protein
MVSEYMHSSASQTEIPKHTEMPKNTRTPSLTSEPARMKIPVLPTIWTDRRTFLPRALSINWSRLTLRLARHPVLCPTCIDESNEGYE